jgi:hypothetical protein
LSCLAEGILARRLIVRTYVVGTKVGSSNAFKFWIEVTHTWCEEVTKITKLNHLINQFIYHQPIWLPVDNLGKKCTINQFITIGQPWGTY